MKIKLILLTLIWTNMIFAQTENYETAFENFQSNYNKTQYNEIFNSFSSEMQSALPLENTELFFTNLKNQVGNILDKEFVNNGKETATIYKTQFERAVLGVYITLDNQNQIAGLFIKPFEEPKYIEDASVNKLNDFPIIISNAIFSKVKSLPNKAQLSIAIIQNGKTNYYGTIRDNSIIRSIKNQDKIFEIGSITKVFTSTVLASMIEDKKIKLTDEINSFYSFDFKDDIKITFKSLANHTSGMPRLPENLDLTNTKNPYINYGKSEIEQYLKDLLKLENKSTKTYAYSNLGAGLLGYTLGISQKISFKEMLKKNIFKKYSMNNSYTTSQNLEGQLVKGLDKKGNIVSNWDFDVLFGGGGILSTTEDLVKFLEAQFEPKNKELQLTRKSTFEINDSLSIGLGWHILKSENGTVLHFHNGGTGGYSSSMTVDLKNKKAVIILSNVADINQLIDAIGFELIKETKE